MFEDHLTAYWHGVRLPSTNKATMISTSPGISSIYIYIHSDPAVPFHIAANRAAHCRTTP